MKLRFLGGAEEVGRLGMVLGEGKASLLCDYGLAPTRPPKFPLEAPRVRHALLSHAHVDHSGMIPMLASRQRTQVIATPPTADVGLLLMSDSIKVMESQGYDAPYTPDDVKATERAFELHSYGQAISIGPWEVVLHSAGHIPGSTMFEMTSGKRFLFTGDINTINTRLVSGTRPVKCDVLVIEGTYSGREHPKRARIEYDLLGKVEEVVSRGGTVILPAFAVGRTQELMLLMRKQGYDVRVDGMGKAVTKIYLQHQSYLRDAKKMRKAASEVRFINGFRQRKGALDAEVIITTSGMLDGGPVLEYLSKLKDDKNSAVLLTGYQVEGTNGRKLMDTGTIDIDGTRHRINCEVGFYDLSAHAGHSQLVEFIKGCRPEKVVLMHSDDRDPLMEELADDFEFILPETGREIEV